MIQILGNFRETLPNSHEFLLLGFSASSFPLQKRWRNNGLSANFIADYLTTFFPTQDPRTVERFHSEEVKSAVSYIANELLENAMKFSFQDSQEPVRFGLHLLTEENQSEINTIVLSTTNSIDIQSVPGFQAFIDEVLTSDLDELYLRQVERSVSEEACFSSGLGFITMKNDYSAQLGWKFETIDSVESAIAVTTMVQIKL